MKTPHSKEELAKRTKRGPPTSMRADEEITRAVDKSG